MTADIKLPEPVAWRVGSSYFTKEVSIPPALRVFEWEPLYTADQLREAIAAERAWHDIEVQRLQRMANRLPALLDELEREHADHMEAIDDAAAEYERGRKQGLTDAYDVGLDTKKTVAALQAEVERHRNDIHSCHANCPRAGCVNARLREVIRTALNRNGGPIDRCDTVDRVDYVMVRRDDFDDMASAIDTARSGEPK